jgi:hypothetical protein
MTDPLLGAAVAPSWRSRARRAGRCGRGCADDRWLGPRALDDAGAKGDCRRHAARGRERTGSSRRDDSTPRLGDRPQRLAVDPGIYRGGLLLAVAQHLADLRQRRARPEHLGRRAMPETVSAHAGKPRPGTRLADEPPDRVRRQPPKRRCHAQNRARLSHRGRRGRYDASASPTSTGSGNTSCREPLPRIKSSPARQLTSSSLIAATSPRRSPNRASNNRIA